MTTSRFVRPTSVLTDICFGFLRNDIPQGPPLAFQGKRDQSCRIAHFLDHGTDTDSDQRIPAHHWLQPVQMGTRLERTD